MTTESRHEELLKGSLNALERGSESALKLARETKTPFWIWRNGMCVDLLAEENACYEDAELSEPLRVREEPQSDLEENTD